MTGISIGESKDRLRSPWWRGPRTKKALLNAGIASAGVYVVGDVVTGLLYDRYSFVNQAISELTAFGSPVRREMQAIILVHGSLLVAFGAGILLVADQASLRWVGRLLVAVGGVGFPTHTVWAMTSRGMETGFNDTMHITMSALFSILVMAAMFSAAITFQGWFRRYSLLTLALMTGFGIASSIQMRGIKQDNTPGAGAFERIDAYAYLAWLAALAVTVMRRVLDRG